MSEHDITYEHNAYHKILASRGWTDIQKDTPFWKIRLNDIEYDSLKATLSQHLYELYKYGMEAALCYAEWWRRDYAGNIPSKEEVAVGLGLPRRYSDELYMAARTALEKQGFTFIHSQKGTEYFRTLLNQGGLPVNYIKNTNGNFRSFTWFLKGLVSELSVINYDWSEDDHSIIQQLNCISYLGKAFKNDNIYDVAMQIAHAIIMDDNTLLPYDDTDTSLKELTNSLKKEYQRSKHDRKARPLSLHWRLSTHNGQGNLFVNMDVVKDISSDSIPGINISTCYSFDVLVAGTFVGKYARKSINKDEEGNIINATYMRVSMGVNKDILWKGEPVVEVKVRCDNDERIFLTISGCYPPNFEHPQVFQMLDDNLYSKSETPNAENNLAIFTPQWKSENARPIKIGNQELLCEEFTDQLFLVNETEHERVTLTNKFTPYTAEFSGNYISWVEKSNYKLLSKIPTIRVYDKDKNRIQDQKKKYRIRSKYSDRAWHNLNSSCVIPPGLVDIRVEFPDGHYCVETFYAIGDLSFESRNAQVLSTDIICSCDTSMHPELGDIQGVEVTNLTPQSWRISRSKDATNCPSTCDFRIYNEGNPTLLISVAIPFDGVTITDVNGNLIPNKKIISFANLSYFSIISHGNKSRTVDVSYISDKTDDGTKIKHLQNNVIDGIVSLSDYSDLIERMFNLYGANTFNRTSSVVLSISGREIYIRKFVLDTNFIDGKILVVDGTEDNTADFLYKDCLYAFPVDEDITSEEFYPIKLDRRSETENVFTLPEGFEHNEVVVFSGPEAQRRIIPKYFNLRERDFGVSERSAHSSQVTSNWLKLLRKEDVMMGDHWRMACKAFEMCSRYNLPFTTYNGLKAITRVPKLLAKFILAMWINENKDILCQDIERFEQEMVIAIHWIPAQTWMGCIDEMLSSLPDMMRDIIMTKWPDLGLLLQDLFNSTLSTDVASEFTQYIISETLSKGNAFTNSDINNYKMRIHGLSDNNMDLPIIQHQLVKRYYPNQSMPATYRVMLESAMSAAENTCGITHGMNLFSKEGKEHARVVNFYRKYFKETYSDVFFRTVKLIESN